VLYCHYWQVFALVYVPLVAQLTLHEPNTGLPSFLTSPMLTVQMAGRAGRPQFDDSGVVAIMTRQDTVHLYRNLMVGSAPNRVRVSKVSDCITPRSCSCTSPPPYTWHHGSLPLLVRGTSSLPWCVMALPVSLCRLMPTITEHLNAEIVLLTVSDVSLAIDWYCSLAWNHA